MRMIKGAGWGMITTVAGCAFAGLSAQTIVTGPLLIGATLGAISGIESRPRHERIVYEAEVEVMGRC